jgi:hypothetical protein
MVGAKRRPAREDTSSWFTRGEVADMLGVSPQTIMNYETRKLLNPALVSRRIERRGLRTVYVYDPREVAKLPARVHPAMVPSDGEIAARCFELFDEGRSLREVVRRARVTPGKASELHNEWLDMGGSEIVINDAAKADLEEKLGPFADVADLVELVRKHVP